MGFTNVISSLDSCCCSLEIFDVSSGFDDSSGVISFFAAALSCSYWVLGFSGVIVARVALVALAVTAAIEDSMPLVAYKEFVMVTRLS